MESKDNEIQIPVPAEIFSAVTAKILPDEEAGEFDARFFTQCGKPRTTDD